MSAFNWKGTAMQIEQSKKLQPLCRNCNTEKHQASR